MAESSPPDFDWSQAESLLGDDPQAVPQDMADIVLELVEGSEHRFVELKAFNPATDRPAISAAAHQLRGSLLNFGFVAVGAVLLEIEKRDYPADEYPSLVTRAEATFVASKKLLGVRYPSLKLG